MLPEALHSELILSSLQLVLCSGAAVKRLLIHHHSADYIFLSFRITGFILSQFKRRVPLNPVVGAWTVLHLYVTAHEQIQ